MTSFDEPLNAALQEASHEVPGITALEIQKAKLVIQGKSGVGKRATAKIRSARSDDIEPLSAQERERQFR
jgi:hypothetical protein